MGFLGPLSDSNFWTLTLRTAVEKNSPLHLHTAEDDPKAENVFSS